MQHYYILHALLSIYIDLTYCRELVPWHKRSVLLTHLQQCHLIDHEQQLLSIILSHCNYSLEVGKGRSVLYNYEALEKHILDRFIYGKPSIEVTEIPHVLYQNDICTRVTFGAIRRKVNPQVSYGSFKYYDKTNKE